MRIFRALSGLAAVLFAAGAVCAGENDWPQWGGTNGRNMAAGDMTVPAVFPEKPAWETEVGEWLASPAAAGGVVVLGSYARILKKLEPDRRLGGSREGIIWCLDAATGTCRWRLPVPSVGYGACTTAVIRDKRVYTATGSGVVLCLDIEGLANGNDGPFTDEGRFMGGGKRAVELKPGIDGDIIWTFDIPAELGTYVHDTYASSPMIHDGLLYIGTSNAVGRPVRKEDVKPKALHYWKPDENPKRPYTGQGHDQAKYPNAASLIALDPATGRLVAKDDEKIGWGIFHGQWSAPTAGQVDGRTLIFYGAGDGFCYAFEPPARGRDNEVQILKKVWRTDCNPKEYRIDDEGREISYASRLRSADLFANRAKRRMPLEITGTPVFHDGRVYVTIGGEHGRGAGGAVTCIDAATGEKVWECKDLKNSLSTVSVANGLVFAVDYSGGFQCIDAAGGTHLWSHKVSGSDWNSSMVLGDKVFFNKYAFACAKEKKVLSESSPGTPFPAGRPGMVVTMKKGEKTVRAYAFEEGETVAAP